VTTSSKVISASPLTGGTVKLTWGVLSPLISWTGGPPVCRHAKRSGLPSGDSLREASRTTRETSGAI
jgi:hypothetical protein